MAGQNDPNLVSARGRYDELRLAHEAATGELVLRRERLKTAEARRATDPENYRNMLASTREQRDRVVDLVEQVKQAGAILTLAEARAKGGRS